MVILKNAWEVPCLPVYLAGKVCVLTSISANGVSGCKNMCSNNIAMREMQKGRSGLVAQLLGALQASEHESTRAQNSPATPVTEKLCSLGFFLAMWSWLILR